VGRRCIRLLAFWYGFFVDKSFYSRVVYYNVRSYSRDLAFTDCTITCILKKIDSHRDGKRLTESKSHNLMIIVVLGLASILMGIVIFDHVYSPHVLKDVQIL